MPPKRARKDSLLAPAWSLRVCLVIACFVYFLGVLMINSNRQEPPASEAAAGGGRRKGKVVAGFAAGGAGAAGAGAAGAAGAAAGGAAVQPAKGSVAPLESLDYAISVARSLAALSPDELLKTLAEKDPFGVRRFDEALVAAEAKLGATLSKEQLRELFPCPRRRVSLPDLRDHSRAEAFSAGLPDTFLFFQHLRKAGGTGFCSLAEANLPRKNLPGYYCMPDYGWEGGWRQRQAGFLKHWSNEEITRRLREKGHRVAGNEWDKFQVRHFDLPGAVFATSFRRPLDRALSQFRFECAEHRGCTHERPETWWPARPDLWNVYSLTFADGQAKKTLWAESTPEAMKYRMSIIEQAIRVLARFNLVLVMEWLSYAAESVTKELGFRDTRALTKRVRPHISQAKRDGGETVSGAATVRKASWVPEEVLSPKLYKLMSESLAIDEILNDVARRLFLERLVCPA